MSEPPPVMPDGIADFPSDIDDADFGALEMFDSNSMPPPFSSQANALPIASSGQVPEAVMAEEAMPPPSPKNHRRGKSASEHAVESSLPSPDGRSKKKHKSKKDKRSDHQVPDSQAIPDEYQTTDNPMPSTDTPSELNGGGAEAALLSTKSNKKRKFSDSAHGKRRKKRRSHGHHDTQEQGGAEARAAAADFLRKSNDAGIPSASAVDDNVEGSDPQKSPTVAHLRRRSQSREARSRENSVPPPEADGMEVDPPAGQGAPVDAIANHGVPVDADVEALAREAWNEHRNGQGSIVNTQETNGTAVDAQPAEPSDPSSSKRRSTRKKAKPTFFEQPPAEVSNDEANAARDALAELPSPTAVTPNPRGRAKTAAKKTAKGKKPKREKAEKATPPPPTHGGFDEYGAGEGHGEDEAGRARRNRLVGFTQGRFSDDELARIARAVESFRADNDLTQEQVNQMIHVPGGTTAGEDHAQLWVRIFAECPDRHRQKVINITRKKFHNFVARGTWTLEQDIELSDLIGVHGTKWSKIAAIINRHPEDLRDRYRNYLVCGQNQRKDAWTEAEEAQLTQYVIDAMDAIDELRTSAPNPSLLDMSYEELIDWQNISERMGRTRSRLQCITKWKSLNIRTHGKDKLISGEPDAQISFRLEKARRQIAAMPEEEKFRLVLAIQATAVGKDAKIPWQRLVDKQFRNQWHRPTQMLLWRRLRQTLPGWEAKTTRDCALELVERYNHSGELPDVNGDGYDDTQEMEYVQGIRAASFVTNMVPGVRQHGNMSAEFITDSDMEEANGAAAGNDDEGAEDDDDLNIDPALIETPAPAKKATTAKRTGTGKPPSRKKSKKAPTANMDPIEDVGPSQEQPADGQDGDSEVEVPPSRQKKTPKQFKSPQDKRKVQLVSPRSAGSETGMEDMEDLPAKLPA
ncbi:myb-like DNA-binding domain-containing protein [Hirsutella rhossiliensis]|uniref:Myb-like DNA-binding domain-containing protein n=1 Tax=Hirsutella rhossiliensis TaxID=111463 RepID=A0A9P8MP05_9HYPO|nr:myb-like DNA-binding domain-containing protein [Hirsutella rhossiliensis]KAH0959698.1 myb-like DNA-binding domain-containing protein [Hirsutella rhossiliensis]